MNFTSIVNAVLAKCKRPDKLEMIRTEVNASTLFFSTEHDYDGDVVEFVRPVTPPDLKSSEFILSMTELTRFRKMDYLRVSGTRHYVKKLASRELGRCTDIRDTWYRAGSNINVLLSVEAPALDVSYYQYPPLLTDLAPDYWMLEGNWSAVMEHAAATIFNDIGDTQSADRALRKAMMDGGIFKSDYIRDHS